jgi:signal transduction histidine kinase/ActR/RegA family two-component response regulator
LSDDQTRPITTRFDADYADLFDNAPCGYVSTDPSGRILQVNRTLATWLKVKASDLSGRRFQDLLNIAGKIYYDTHFAPLLRMQGYFNEVALDLVDGEGARLPVLVNALERRKDGGDVAFIRITVFNAVDRRQYEQALLEARRRADEASAALLELNHTLEQRVKAAVAEQMAAEAALRQAQKMEAIGQLTGGVAHDFNNLLTVILGGLESIQKQAPALPDEPGRRIQRAAAMATHGAERAATLTARLLAFSRKQPLDPRAVDAARLVTGLADLLERTLGEAVDLQTVVGAGLWKTFVDAGELENALVNLAVNARDAMPEGGRLTIETSNAWLDEDYLAMVTEPVQAGQYVLVAVSDTGSGMDAETIARVFEPFFTTKAVGKGTGLGLSQVYGFVRQTGGHIQVYSELGEGTTVKLYLPRASEDALEGAETPTVDTAVRGRGETVLIVEDHEALRGYASDVLAEFGYRIVAVEDAAEALKVLRTSQLVDLLFTDVILPGGMDGRRLADAAATLRPELKVLFTTGYSRNAIVHNGRLDAGVHLISKPFTSSGLCRKVRAILDEGADEAG